jgi:uncharacterized protein YegJ (DUF2314 family)
MQLVQDQSATVLPALDQMSDPMSEAIQKARASIGKFFSAHRVRRASQTDFRIQAIFHDGQRREQIWLSHLDFNTKPATGIVSTRTRLKTASYGKRVPFRPDQMSDWMYRDNGRIVGGFTMKIPVNRERKDLSFLDRLKRRLVA